jgi:hypothetical protein
VREVGHRNSPVEWVAAANISLVLVAEVSLKAQAGPFLLGYMACKSGPRSAHGAFDLRTPFAKVETSGVPGAPHTHVGRSSSALNPWKPYDYVTDKEPAREVIRSKGPTK